MGIKGLGEYLAVKYAGNKVFASEVESNDSLPDDVAPTAYEDIVGVDKSLGAPIPLAMVQRYKDKLIAVYDRIKEELTQLPFFKQIYVDMKGDPLLLVFNDIIDAYTVNIANAATLKDAFLFGVNYIDSFNQLRSKLPSTVKDKERLHRLDDAIYNTQMYMWPKLKAMLNIHDIGRDVVPLNPKDKADMSKILNRLPSGTWNYGHIKNPTKAPFRKNVADTPGRLMKRLEDENLKDDIRKRLGPYASEQDVEDELIRLKDLDKKQRQDAAKQKYNQSLPGRDKNKFR